MINKWDSFGKCLAMGELLKINSKLHFTFNFSVFYETWASSKTAASRNRPYLGMLIFFPTHAISFDQKHQSENIKVADTFFSKIIWYILCWKNNFISIKLAFFPQDISIIPMKSKWLLCKYEFNGKSLKQIIRCIQTSALAKAIYF